MAPHQITQIAAEVTCGISALLSIAALIQGVRQRAAAWVFKMATLALLSCLLTIASWADPQRAIFYIVGALIVSLVAQRQAPVDQLKPGG